MRRAEAISSISAARQCASPEAKVRGHVRGATRPRLVPSDHGELVMQGCKLRLPHPAIQRAAVYEYER